MSEDKTLGLLPDTLVHPRHLTIGDPPLVLLAQNFAQVSSQTCDNETSSVKAARQKKMRPLSSEAGPQLRYDTR
ncbi:hypothetical protein LMH87_004783 [Akanthomyces muscarius]|uniref:Uncharacterized protein n=1 Tax=Akanthomyces muscarius TaxID=2231603 RepID=A0A9W8Q6C1_AKAMU|nr:hypothetical protein LMH87_004783 [Akanthomyces muscarius]KAJ4145952.1 hypothetical protein LMH87_004783 [Akanthomyces muscarius]